MSTAHPAGYEIAANGSGTYSLKIWGRFPPNWAGNLSSGLSKNRVSIIRGVAKKVKTQWTAEFEIMPERLATIPESMDFLAMAQNGSVAEKSCGISLDEFTLGEPASNYGALYLEIRAGDQTGFLAELLNRLAFFSLFPEEMIIDTNNGRIFDRFWIKGVGGSIPSEHAAGTLRMKLDSYLKH